MRTREWTRDAACLNADWEMTDYRNITQSKKLCNACPVFRSCRQWAMTDQAVGIPGVLAGLTFTERGQVACVACETIVRKVNTRNGQCWSCYKSKREVA
jgi:Transcription factor WhiB